MSRDMFVHRMNDDSGKFEVWDTVHDRKVVEDILTESDAALVAHGFGLGFLEAVGRQEASEAGAPRASGTLYMVLNNHTLGYIQAERPMVFCPLAADIHGHDWKNGPLRLFKLGQALVPATLEDFERFRVDPKGHIS